MLTIAHFVIPRALSTLLYPPRRDRLYSVGTIAGKLQGKHISDVAMTWEEDEAVTRRINSYLAGQSTLNS
jgi:hypothetical protein